MQLVQQLKETTVRQRAAYNNLDKVTSEGYDYYQWSFAEKLNHAKQKEATRSQNQSRFTSLDVANLPLDDSMLKSNDRVTASTE